MWDPAEHELSMIADDVSFDRETARALYRIGLGGGELSARWSRIMEEIRFADVVAATHKSDVHEDAMISCPFHGTDRRPSFKLYKGSNDAYCYGCPSGHQYYDSVRFVAAIQGITEPQAIRWLEKQYDLPPLEEEEDDEDDETEIEVVSLNFTHLSEPYIEKAAQAFRETLNPALAREYIALYFEAAPSRKDQSPGRPPDFNSEENLIKAASLARVLGWKALEEIKKRKLNAL